MLCFLMDLNRAAAILAPRLQLKCLGASFGGQNKGFQSLRSQYGRRVIKAHENIHDCLTRKQTGTPYFSLIISTQKLFCCKVRLYF